MSKFKFTKQKHTGKTNIWYDNILIGELSFYMKENLDTPPQKYRSDEARCIQTNERWITSWKAHIPANMTTVGSYNNKEEAAQAVLNKHRSTFERENDS